MTKKFFYSALLLAAGICIVALPSCKKEETAPEDPIKNHVFYRDYDSQLNAHRETFTFHEDDSFDYLHGMYADSTRTELVSGTEYAGVCVRYTDYMILQYKQKYVIVGSLKTEEQDFDSYNAKVGYSYADGRLTMRFYYGDSIPEERVYIRK